MEHNNEASLVSIIDPMDKMDPERNIDIVICEFEINDNSQLGILFEEYKEFIQTQPADGLSMYISFACHNGIMIIAFYGNTDSIISTFDSIENNKEFSGKFTFIFGNFIKNSYVDEVAITNRSINANLRYQDKIMNKLNQLDYLKYFEDESFPPLATINFMENDLFVNKEEAMTNKFIPSLTQMASYNDYKLCRYLEDTRSCRFGMINSSVQQEIYTIYQPNDIISYISSAYGNQLKYNESNQTIGISIVGLLDSDHRLNSDFVNQQMYMLVNELRDVIMPYLGDAVVPFGFIISPKVESGWFINCPNTVTLYFKSFNDNVGTPFICNVIPAINDYVYETMTIHEIIDDPKFEVRATSHNEIVDSIIRKANISVDENNKPYTIFSDSLSIWNHDFDFNDGFPLDQMSMSVTPEFFNDFNTIHEGKSISEKINLYQKKSYFNVVERTLPDLTRQVKYNVTEALHNKPNGYGLFCIIMDYNANEEAVYNLCNSMQLSEKCNDDFQIELIEGPRSYLYGAVPCRHDRGISDTLICLAQELKGEIINSSMLNTHENMKHFFNTLWMELSKVNPKKCHHSIVVSKTFAERIYPEGLENENIMLSMLMSIPTFSRGLFSNSMRAFNMFLLSDWLNNCNNYQGREVMASKAPYFLSCSVVSGKYLDLNTYGVELLKSITDKLVYLRQNDPHFRSNKTFTEFVKELELSFFLTPGIEDAKMVIVVTTYYDDLSQNKRNTLISHYNEAIERTLEEYGQRVSHDENGYSIREIDIDDVKCLINNIMLTSGIRLDRKTNKYVESDESNNAINTFNFLLRVFGRRKSCGDNDRVSYDEQLLRWSIFKKFTGTDNEPHSGMKRAVEMAAQYVR